MKIKNDYDLEKMVKQSIHGKSFKSIIGYLVGGNCVVLLPEFLILNALNDGDIKKIAGRMTFTICFSAISDLAIAYGLQKSSKEYRVQQADRKLRLFISQLQSLEVRTSTELLKEAKITKVNYKPQFKDKDKIKPRLKQIKEIEVPLCNGYYETILQEHIIGYKDYDVSVKEPDKKISFKLAKQLN